MTFQRQIETPSDTLDNGGFRTGPAVACDGALRTTAVAPVWANRPVWFAASLAGGVVVPAGSVGLPQRGPRMRLHGPANGRGAQA